MVINALYFLVDCFYVVDQESNDDEDIMARIN